MNNTQSAIWSNDHAIQDAKPSFLSRLDLAQWFRLLGAVAIIASMSLFTLNGWHEGNDLSRYLSLLAQTSLLGVGGLLVRRSLKDQRSARVFFILALASIIANATILGALIYSMLPLDQVLVDYPDAMRWVAIDPLTFIPVALGSGLLMAALSLFGFAILNRPQAKQLSVAFILLCALLLVPLRLPVLSLSLASIALISAIFIILKLQGEQDTVLTLETKIAYALLLAPGVVIAARALLLYPLEVEAMLVFSGLSVVALRFLQARLAPSIVLDALYFVACVALCLSLAGSLSAITRVFELIVVYAVWMCLASDQILFSKHRESRKFWLGFLAFGSTPVYFLWSLVPADIWWTLSALIVAVWTVGLHVYVARDSGNKVLGYTMSFVTMVLVSILFAIDLVELVTLGNWLILAIAGTGLILSASLYERFGGKRKRAHL